MAIILPRWLLLTQLVLQQVPDRLRVRLSSEERIPEHLSILGTCRQRIQICRIL